MKNESQLEVKKDSPLEYRNKFDLEEVSKFKLKHEENSIIKPINKSLLQIRKKIYHKIKTKERKSFIKYRIDKKYILKLKKKSYLIIYSNFQI